MGGAGEDGKMQGVNGSKAEGGRLSLTARMSPMAPAPHPKTTHLRIARFNSIKRPNPIYYSPAMFSRDYMTKGFSDRAPANRLVRWERERERERERGREREEREREVLRTPSLFM